MSVFKDHRFEGQWCDKYNFKGYAVGEMTRFEQMVKRGSLVEISYQEQVFKGVIFDWEFIYKGDWQINYRFSFSVHLRSADPKPTIGRTDATRALPPPSEEDALAMVTRSTSAVIDAQDGMPRAAIAGDLSVRVDAALNQLIDARNKAAATISTAKLEGVSVGKAIGFAQQGIDQWKRLGTRFRSVETQAALFVDQLVDVRTDVTVGWQSVDSFFTTERWSRSSRYYGRLAMGDARTAADAMDAKAAPPSVQTYQAASGESLYAIAKRFYGDPLAWRFIAHQNGLTTPVISDATTLVIPLRAV